MSRVIKFRTFFNGVMSKPFKFGEAVRFPDGSAPVGSNFELMQFTGLRDVNGVEIYEGDIIHMYYSNWLDEISTVIFRNGTYGYGSEFMFTAFQCLNADTMREGGDNFTVALKVIGNIYEHPHLLDGNK